ncbi:MAG: ribonuclease III [Lachnospiraceae bacterium]|nr:ribonuclease III [Lachnospiraceae bacterium]
MDESLMQQICGTFSVERADLRTYSPLALAYIGDGIFDLVIRTLVVCGGNASAKALHKHTSQIVKAASQAKLAEAVADELTEDEQDVFRRGRNAKSRTMAKNASMRDYRTATGYEALVGYLYLDGQMDRLLALVRMGLEKEFGEIIPRQA